MIEIYLTPIRQDISLSDGSVVGGREGDHTPTNRQNNDTSPPDMGKSDSAIGVRENYSTMRGRQNGSTITDMGDYDYPIGRRDISHTEKPCRDCSAKSLLNNVKEQGGGALKCGLKGDWSDDLCAQPNSIAESGTSSTVARPQHREDDPASRAYKRELTVRLLGLIFAQKFNTPPPVLAYSDNGKPYFANSDLLVNVSHSGNLLAVAISDEGKGLGVDIQLAPTDGQRMAKLYNRYKRHFDALPTIKQEIDGSVSVYFVELDSLNACFKPINPTQRVQNSLPCDDIRVFNPIIEVRSSADCQPSDQDISAPDFLSSWTRAEAILKADGIGITGMCQLPDLSKKCSKLLALCLDHNGEEYSLSLAVIG